jgi:8-oxo-dGTP pyrophosphatase MutT (NUDIX family)
MDKETIRALLAIPEAEQEIPDGTWRRASVLSLFMENEKGLSLLFTRRTNHVVDHKGQVSFPGGAVEPEDVSLEDAALRETREEIGVMAADIELLGRSRDMFTVSGWWITPVIAWYTRQNGYTLNPAEVSRIFTIPIDWLCRRENWKNKTYVRNGVIRSNVIFYNSYDGETLWGITAQLVHDLLRKMKIME